ncbi:hypothetical protein B9Q01_04375 [Candidatus Marsarchaeota G1 archaeon OSP_D]|jgi:Xaa-Pro aminopeptidase|uniref:Peptidase M24 domain-containing protein n=1 Tax=Candidatus Marsarchaeota G1 archaeon OSP_D TaxID=1978155 RepID=A0A2R6AB19_9ARCH|nr:MAG: hypothetical protein B9Q01_04375 [Candidatus Marsarchaeota G1 archaeon OSP_D]
MNGSGIFPRFSDKEFERRDFLVKQMMKRKRVDVLLIYSSSQSDLSVNYLSGYLALRPTYLVYPLEGEPTLILHFRNHMPCAKEMSVIKNITWHFNDPVSSLLQIIKSLKCSSIGVVGNNIPYAHLKALEHLTGYNFVDVTEDYNLIRWIRSEEEIDWFKKSAQLTDLAMEKLEKSIKVGVSLHELNALMHSAFLAKGGQPVLNYIAATNMHEPKLFVPWQFPTDKTLQKGDVVITEISVGYYGYASQMHRPFAVQQNPTRLYQTLFEVALECFERVSKVLRDGATAQDVVEASSIIEERGFTIFDSVLHGENGKNPEIGIASSEHPLKPFTFKKNMIVTVQPNPVTHDLKAGLQLGSTVVIRENGVENLSSYPFNFPVCG